MKPAFLSLPLLLILALSYALSQTAAPPKREQDEKGIKQMLTGFVEAWNRHDAKAFSMLFTEDADFTNVRGMSANGRTEIEKLHAPRFATNFKDSNQKITETTIRFLSPDIAAVDARWEMTGAKGPDGQEIPLRKGLLNLIMTRSSGQWLIMVIHNMDLPQQ